MDMHAKPNSQIPSTIGVNPRLERSTKKKYPKGINASMRKRCLRKKVIEVYRFTTNSSGTLGVGKSNVRKAKIHASGRVQRLNCRLGVGGDDLEQCPSRACWLSSLSLPVL